MKITFITGAGVSRESGIPTFRDADGLWLNHKVEDVANIKGWNANPALVLEFYNKRRRELDSVKPNAAHELIAKLEKDHDVWVVTQNVDDLHERAGSTKILHLHGQLKQCRSSINPNLVLPYDKDIAIGDEAPDGSQLRPDVVWFGEDVPAFGSGCMKVARAEVVVVVGTSLAVYPAASLVEYVRQDATLFVIDPDEKFDIREHEHIKLPATKGMKKFVEKLSILEK